MVRDAVIAPYLRAPLGTVFSRVNAYKCVFVPLEAQAIAISSNIAPCDRDRRLIIFKDRIRHTNLGAAVSLRDGRAQIIFETHLVDIHLGRKITVMAISDIKRARAPLPLVMLFRARISDRGVVNEILAARRAKYLNPRPEPRLIHASRQKNGFILAPLDLQSPHLRDDKTGMLRKIDPGIGFDCDNAGLRLDCPADIITLVRSQGRAALERA